MWSKLLWEEDLQRRKSEQKGCRYELKTHSPMITHTHTLACAQYLAKPCKWRTPISLNAQASAGKGWSRRNLEALDASKKAFHWAFEIGDSGSSQAKSRWLQSSPPAKWGWTKCPLYVATPLSYYLRIGTETAAARATYVQTAPKTWSISQLYINWAVGELFFVHKTGGVPHEHPSVLLPPPACGQKSHDRGQDWCVACVASGHELIEIFRRFHGTRQTAWDGWDKVGWVEEACDELMWRSLGGCMMHACCCHLSNLANPGIVKIKDTRASVQTGLKHFSTSFRNPSSFIFYTLQNLQIYVFIKQQLLKVCIPSQHCLLPSGPCFSSQHKL